MDQLTALNSLIAIISNSFEKVFENKQAEINQTYARLLLENYDVKSAAGFWTWYFSYALGKLQYMIHAVVGHQKKEEKEKEKEPISWWYNDDNELLHEVEKECTWVHQLRRAQDSQRLDDFYLQAAMEKQEVHLKKIRQHITREFDLPVGTLAREMSKIKSELSNDMNSKLQSIRKDLAADAVQKEKLSSSSSSYLSFPEGSGVPSELLVRGGFSVQRAAGEVGCI